MTTVEALKELFTALGGSEEDVKAITTNPEMVHAIAEVASGAIELPKVTAADAGDILAVDESGKWAKAEPESGLPEVTAEDNGDVLAVVEGAWAKSAPGSGVEHIIYEIDANGKLQNGKNAKEVYDDIVAGKIVELQLISGSFMRFWVIGVWENSFCFGCVSNNATTLSVYTYTAENVTTSMTTLSYRSKTATAS